MLRTQGIMACFLAGAFCTSAAEDLTAGTPPWTMERTSGGAQSYWVEQLAEGLNFPSSMAWLPNGDLLITERMGGLRVWRNGALDPQPIRGMPASFQGGRTAGVRDILVDPDYA